MSLTSSVGSIHHYFQLGHQEFLAGAAETATLDTGFSFTLPGISFTAVAAKSDPLSVAGFSSFSCVGPFEERLFPQNFKVVQRDDKSVVAGVSIFAVARSGVVTTAS